MLVSVYIINPGGKDAQLLWCQSLCDPGKSGVYRHFRSVTFRFNASQKLAVLTVEGRAGQLGFASAPNIVSRIKIWKYTKHTHTRFTVVEASVSRFDSLKTQQTLQLHRWVLLIHFHLDMKEEKRIQILL